MLLHIYFVFRLAWGVIHFSHLLLVCMCVSRPHDASQYFLHCQMGQMGIVGAAPFYPLASIICLAISQATNIFSGRPKSVVLILVRECPLRGPTEASRPGILVPVTSSSWTVFVSPFVRILVLCINCYYSCMHLATTAALEINYYYHYRLI